MSGEESVSREDFVKLFKELVRKAEEAEKREKLRELSEEEKRALKEIFDEMDRIGMECGRKIAELAKKMFPNVVCALPLYRSCIVIEKEEVEGRCIHVYRMHFFADPHWMGEEITEENLRKRDYHVECVVAGNRTGPRLIFDLGDRVFEFDPLTIDVLAEELTEYGKFAFLYEKKKRRGENEE